MAVVSSLADGTSLPALFPSPAVLRLLVIPLLVNLAWLLEIFLLAGNNHLLEYPDPGGIALYTVVGCILTGMVIPIICIRKAFMTGAVNMFQIGFRTARRTIVICSVTAGLCFGIFLLVNPFGTDRLASANAFILILPTMAASVMVCWALAGTHVQAFMRNGGVVFSITTGVVVTTILFASAVLAANPSARQEGPLFWPVCIGIGAALFFFAVRDVYATVIVVTSSRVLTSAGTFDPAYLHGTHPGIYVSTLLAVAALIGIHIWLSRNYATILVTAGHEPVAGK